LDVGLDVGLELADFRGDLVGAELAGDLRGEGGLGFGGPGGVGHADVADEDGGAEFEGDAAGVVAEPEGGAFQFFVGFEG